MTDTASFALSKDDSIAAEQVAFVDRATDLFDFGNGNARDAWLSLNPGVADIDIVVGTPGVTRATLAGWRFGAPEVPFSPDPARGPRRKPSWIRRLHRKESPSNRITGQRL